jgi:DNA modification methylase
MIEHLSDDVTLYLGDCMEILPTLDKVGAIVTDPPYGINKDGQTQSTSKHGGRKGYEFMGWDSERPPKSIFDLMLSISEHQIIWGGNYFADWLPPSMRWLVWDKGQRINQSDGELAWASMQQALRILTMNRVELMKDGAEHPTQKPVQLMKWCIGLLPENCTMICDPYLGSGTTGVACVQLGRKFIGIEKEPKYFDIACRRISDELKRPRLPFDEPVKAIQETMAL